MPGLAAARIVCAVLASGLSFAACATAPPAGAETGASATVFLVRHAEKVKSPDDPELHAVGEERAERLAAMLRDAGITAIHSTDFRRTRDTAAPLARVLGLDVRLYDWDELGVLAEAIRLEGGRHLVVGHSDTTPELVELLGGEPGPPIDEQDEHDRLYVVTIGADGGVTTVLLRYGTM